MINDKEIIEGFRRGDSYMFRQYFYDYCQTAYYMFDHKYDLHNKENLDFMSLAHQYAIYLMEHDWKPLEDRSPQVSLRTWMINGFRFIVLDALKWYKKEYGSLTFEDYLKTFDTNKDFRVNFNKTIQEICDSTNLDSKSKDILVMLLIQGYKTKEVAEMMGITPSAVSQRYNMLKEAYLIPYFRKNFDMDFDMAEVMDEKVCMSESAEDFSTAGTAIQHPSAIAFDMDFDLPSRGKQSSRFQKRITMEKKRTTPERIQELAPGEIFVFGSNLRGMHAGGAAYVAYQKFGAILGQGVGLQGRSYAIPTMQGGVETIKPYVDEFIAFAKEHPEMTFLVTRIGCGIAGFTDWEISPLFSEAHGVENIVLPEGW